MRKILTAGLAALVTTLSACNLETQASIANRQAIEYLSRVCADEKAPSKTILVTGSGKTHDIAKHTAYEESDGMLLYNKAIWDTDKIESLLKTEGRATIYHCHPGAAPIPSGEDIHEATNLVQKVSNLQKINSFRIVGTDGDEVLVSEYNPSPPMTRSIIKPEASKEFLDRQKQGIENLSGKYVITYMHMHPPLVAEMKNRQNAGDKHALFKIMYREIENETGWEVKNVELQK